MTDSPFNQDALKGGGKRTFVKPAEHADDIAIIVEPIQVKKDQNHTYNGQTKIRDEAVAKFTFFKTVEAVEKGEPSEVVPEGWLSQVMLVDTIARLKEADAISLAVLRKVQTQGGSGWVFRPVEDPAVMEKVGAYYTRREEEIAEAVASAPSFDD